MTKVDFRRINLGHILTILTMIACFVVFFGRMEGRLVTLETNTQWLIKLFDQHINKPSSMVAQTKEK